jgi:hypothetical protein
MTCAAGAWGGSRATAAALVERLQAPSPAFPRERERESRPTGIYDGVARLRRLRPDRGLEFCLEETDERVASRSIRTTGRMTTTATPACTGGDFCGGARRASANTMTVPMASPRRQRIEGTSVFRWPKRSPARFAPVMVNGALRIERAKTSKSKRCSPPSPPHRRMPQMRDGEAARTNAYRGDQTPAAEKWRIGKGFDHLIAGIAKPNRRDAHASACEHLRCFVREAIALPASRRSSPTDIILRVRKTITFHLRRI